MPWGRPPKLMRRDGWPQFGKSLIEVERGLAGLRLGVFTHAVFALVNHCRARHPLGAAAN